jgi:GTP cyclohydrolase II
MLSSIGFQDVDLLTNNPEKVSQLADNGINVKSRVSIIVGTCEYNRSYLRTKAARMGHLLRV